MNRYITFFHKINKSDDKTKIIINVFKSISNVMVDNNKDYDDFEFLTQDREDQDLVIEKSIIIKCRLLFYFTSSHCSKHGIS